MAPRYILSLCFLGLLLTQKLSCLEPLLMLNRDTSSDNRNILTLGCLNLTGGQYIDVAVFFLNGSILYDMTDPIPRDDSRIIPNIIPSSNNMITFILRREAEGNFSCGRKVGSINFIKSASKEIVALPVPEVSHPKRLFFAKAGSTAVIECPEKPGALVSRYYGFWKDSNTSEILLDIPRPGSSVPRNYIPDPRYSIDRTSFSLLIQDAALSDSHSTYQCELRVQDPQEPFTLYTYGPSMNVELLAYEPPTITVAPISQIVSSALSPDIVSFTCEAVSFIPPIITWRHKNVNITSGSKYLIMESTFPVSSGQSGTRSLLTVLSINAVDSGVIECLADTAPSPATNQFQLPGDAAEAQLSILGMFDSLEVFITNTEDVIFSLTYPTVFLVPVRLSFIYFEEDGDKNRSLSIVPSIRYTNTSQINYIAVNQQVPFDRFQVEIALVHESVTGPGRNTMLVYDKTSPTCETSLPINIIIFSAVGVVGLIFVSIFLVICTIVCHLQMKSRNKNNLERQNSKNFQDHIDYVKEKLGDNPCTEEKIEFIRLIKTFFQKQAPQSYVLVRSHSMPKNMGSSQYVNTTSLRDHHSHYAKASSSGSLAENPLYANRNSVFYDDSNHPRYFNEYVESPQRPTAAEPPSSPLKLNVYVNGPVNGQDEVDFHEVPKTCGFSAAGKSGTSKEGYEEFPLKDMSHNAQEESTREAETSCIETDGPIKLESSSERPSQLSIQRIISTADSVFTAELDKDMELAKETAEALKIMCKCLNDPNIRLFLDEC